ncbi:DUF4253 domain-containing protein [Pseudomonas sp. IPO3774]|nr:DUF4253 domain-containing protein [Pseudomonas sp. IPO3774]
MYFCDKLLLHHIPVQQSCQALAAFPNGYFTSDRDPAKNFAVARHFSEAHGYELMGVGASYIGFIRAEPPGVCRANAVAKDFYALYNTSDEDLQTRISEVAKAISGRTYLWLRYVE